MVTGKAAHIMMVIAAWSQMDDPNKSAVVDKVEFAPTPSLPGLPTAPGLGHWLGGISHNVPDDRKRAALEFLKWFQTKEAQLATAQAGGIPTHAAVYQRADRRRAPLSLDEADGGVPAARGQHLPVPGSERGHRRARTWAEPGRCRRDRTRGLRSTAWPTKSTP